jgi:RNase P subunit RPR2
MAASTDQIYCVKCKAKTDNVNAERVTMKNGRPATRVQCATCATKKFRIGG